MKDNPFIPRSKANLAIIPGNTDREIIKNLNKLGIKTIPTIKCEDVDESIAYHPDIVIHPLNHKSLVVAPNVYDYYKEVLQAFNLRLIKGEKILGRKYPKDIPYNVGRIKGRAIHNFKYTDELLKFYLKKEGLKFLNIKQGYSKCSISIVDEYSIITEDKPIYKKLKGLGYNPLLINPGYIKLPGQKYGFIGGSTGNLSKDIILFSGSLDYHPEKERIKKYILNRNKKIICLSDRKIIDLGTIITFNCN